MKLLFCPKTESVFRSLYKENWRYYSLRYGGKDFELTIKDGPWDNKFCLFLINIEARFTLGIAFSIMNRLR